MPASEPIEVRFRADLTEALRGILIGAGYYTDLGDHVSDVAMAEDELNESLLPCAYVTSQEEAAEGCIGGEGSFTQWWVVAYVRSSEETIEDEMSRVKADIKRRVLTVSATTGFAGFTNCLEWGGAQKRADVLSVKGSGRVAVRFGASTTWSKDAP